MLTFVRVAGILPPLMGPAEVAIRLRIEKSGIPLKHLAEKAGVSYSCLQKWVSCDQRNITLEMAEKVWFALTRKRLLK